MQRKGKHICTFAYSLHTATPTPALGKQLSILCSKRWCQEKKKKKRVAGGYWVKIWNTDMPAFLLHCTTLTWLSAISHKHTQKKRCGCREHCLSWAGGRSVPTLSICGTNTTVTRKLRPISSFFTINRIYFLICIFFSFQLILFIIFIQHSVSWWGVVYSLFFPECWLISWLFKDKHKIQCTILSTPVLLIKGLKHLTFPYADRRMGVKPNQINLSNRDTSIDRPGRETGWFLAWSALTGDQQVSLIFF